MQVNKGVQLILEEEKLTFNNKWIWRLIRTLFGDFDEQLIQ